MKSCTVLSYYKQYKQTLLLFSPLLKVQEQAENKRGALGSGKQLMHAQDMWFAFESRAAKAGRTHQSCTSLMQEPAETSLSSLAPLPSRRWISKRPEHWGEAQNTPQECTVSPGHHALIAGFVILPKQREKGFFQHSHKACCRQRQEHLVIRQERNKMHERLR